MLVRRILVAAPVLALLVAAACGKDSPSPTAPTVTVGQPSPVSPANGAQIANLSQPVTLTVQNAAVSQATGTTYTFEVASDSGFATKVQTKTAVAEGTGGQTSVRLDALLAGQTYYWHAQAAASGTSGSFGPTYSFSIGAVLSLGAPSAVSPSTSSIVNDRPQLVVSNGSKTGPTGTIVYRFEVSDTATFATTVVSANVAEGSGRTTYTPGSGLPVGRTLYWRVTMVDQTNNISSSPSTIQSFTCNPSSAAGDIATAQGVVLWSGNIPGGTTGNARMSAGWGIATLRDFNGRTFSSPPLEVLRIFDLLDRGLQPDPAIGWMQTNGYPTVAVYYDSVKAIGFPEQYMALIAGAWELVLRVGA